MMDRNEIKMLIELATTFEQADEIMQTYTDFDTDKERIAFLRGLFDCKIIGRSVSDDHTDYVALLTAIVNQKWR